MAYRIFIFIMLFSSCSLVVRDNLVNINKIEKLNPQIWKMTKFILMGIDSQNQPIHPILPENIQRIVILDVSNKRAFSTHIDTSVHGFIDICNIDTLKRKIVEKRIEALFMDKTIEDSTFFQFMFIENQILAWNTKRKEICKTDFNITQDSMFIVQDANWGKVYNFTDNKLRLVRFSNNEYGFSKIEIEFEIEKNDNYTNIFKKIKKYSRARSFDSLYFKYIFPLYKKVVPYE